MAHNSSITVNIATNQCRNKTKRAQETTRQEFKQLIRREMNTHTSPKLAATNTFHGKTIKG